MEKYILTKEELKELIAARLELTALKLGGVDNWEWYGESINDFIRNYMIEFGKPFNEHWDIEDLANEDLKDYE